MSVYMYIYTYIHTHDAHSMLVRLPRGPRSEPTQVAPYDIMLYYII